MHAHGLGRRPADLGGKAQGLTRMIEGRVQFSWAGADRAFFRQKGGGGKGGQELVGEARGGGAEREGASLPYPQRQGEGAGGTRPGAAHEA